MLRRLTTEETTMTEEIKKGEFTSKYAFGEIVEMKMGATCKEAISFSAEMLPALQTK